MNSCVKKPKLRIEKFVVFYVVKIFLLITRHSFREGDLRRQEIFEVFLDFGKGHRFVLVKSQSEASCHITFFARMKVFVPLSHLCQVSISDAVHYRQIYKVLPLCFWACYIFRLDVFTFLNRVTAPFTRKILMPCSKQRGGKFTR